MADPKNVGRCTYLFRRGNILVPHNETIDVNKSSIYCPSCCKKMELCERMGWTSGINFQRYQDTKK